MEVEKIKHICKKKYIIWRSVTTLTNGTAFLVLKYSTGLIYSSKMALTLYGVFFGMFML